MADLSEYKQAIAEAFEGRAVRDAIVAMVQAVEDAINAGSTAALETRVAALETTVSGTNGLETQVSNLTDTVNNTVPPKVQQAINEEARDRYDADYALDQRVTALEGG